MRIVALVAVVALLVAGGFWLARDRANVVLDTDSGTIATTDTSANATPAASPSDVDASPASTSESGEPAEEATEPAAESPPSEDAPAGADTDTTGSAPGADADSPQAEPDVTDEPALPESEDGADADAAVDGAVDGATVDLTTLLPPGYAPVEFLTSEPRRSFTAAEQVLEDGLDYVALLHTNRGDIVVDLYQDLTPITVNSFVFLALNRFYQGVPFHRVLEDFMAQTGDPTGTGSGGPGYQFDDEIVDGVVFDSIGQLAMANAGPGTNGSQFFITFAATPWLTGAHTIFGEVMSGVEVLDTITRVDPSNPSAIVVPTDTLADLAAYGIELPGAPDTTVEDALVAILGTGPVLGQSFTAAGYRGVMGQLGDEPAYGFFPQPDTVLDVVIGARPTQ